jgi:hypothetical protein
MTFSLKRRKLQCFYFEDEYEFEVNFEVEFKIKHLYINTVKIYYHDVFLKFVLNTFAI